MSHACEPTQTGYGDTEQTLSRCQKLVRIQLDPADDLNDKDEDEPHFRI